MIQMKRLILHIKVNNLAKPLNFEMSGEQPVGELIPNLVKGMGWPTEEDGKPLRYWLENQMGLLDNSKNLIESGVKNADVLFLKSGSTIPQEKKSALKPNPFSFKNKS